MQTHTKQVCFRFTPEIRAALELIRERDGVGFSEQLRRGIKLWIESKHLGVLVNNVPPGRRGRRRG